MPISPRTKGDLMSVRPSAFFTYVFFAFFVCFLAVHYAYMKGETSFRGPASSSARIEPWYIASYKI